MTVLDGVSVQDDTRERADPSVEARDTCFGQLADASPAFLWILDRDGYVAHANTVARQIQPPTTNNQKLHWRDIWPDTTRFSVDRALSEANAGRPFRFRTRFHTAAGADIYLDTTASPVRDADGTIVRLLVKADDVTVQVESAAFLNTVIDVLPLALTVKDARTGRYILGNRAAERLFDQPEGLAGLRPVDILPPPFAAWEARQHANPAELQSAVHHDVTPRRERWLSAVKVATYDDDGVRHVIGLAEDVTQQRRDEAALREALDKAREAGRARRVFLSNVSHELRTPLNGVVAGIDLIAARAADRPDAEVLEMVRASAQALERRLEDLMRMVQVETCESEPRMEPIDLDALLAEAASHIAPAATAKGLALRIDCTVSGQVWGDRPCLAEALGRLVDNAVKFSERGEIVLAAEPLPGGRVRISVSDQGPGFDPALKARLFDGFQQGDDSLTRRHGGLGLGLSIAREAAHRLGGTLDAAPRRDGGSIFWLEAPLSVATPARAGPTDRPAAPAGLRVLVADDHPTNRRIVELMLDGLAEVTSVEDGVEAVEAAARTSFDVILMDIQMPRMDGVTAVARIRAAETGARRVPIIMLTANTQPEHVEASRAAGADRHVGKPFTAAVLLDAIQSVLPVEPQAPPAAA